MKRARVPRVQEMDDETLIKHMEHRHPDALRMKFTVEPGRKGRRLHARKEWETFHDTIHRLDAEGKYGGHRHGQRSGIRDE